jgi:hypothetical protein
LLFNKCAATYKKANEFSFLKNRCYWGLPILISALIQHVKLKEDEKKKLTGMTNFTVMMFTVREEIVREAEAGVANLFFFFYLSWMSLFRSDSRTQSLAGKILLLKNCEIFITSSLLTEHTHYISLYQNI